MANKNFEIKNGLTIAGTERISSSGAFTGSLASATTATTQSSLDNSTKIATTAYTDAAITAVIGGAPGTLDTLNELAAAINDDASYATTLTTALATKLPLAGGTLTGPLTVSPSSGTAKISFTSQGAGSEVFSVNGQIPGVNNTGFAIRNETDSRNDFMLDGSGNATFSGDVTTSYGFQAGYFKIGSTVIVNANRDLTNIGTISSGAITSTGTITASGGNTNNTDDANILTLNSSEHARLLVDTSSTSGHRATLALESNSNELTLSTTGSNSYLINPAGTFNLQIATDKVVSFAPTIGEIGNVTGFQATNTAGSANTDFGIRATSIRFATGSSEKVRVASTGHLQFNPINSFSGLNNSILSSSNTYMYMMGGAAGLYLGDNEDIENAIGIRNAGYIDFMTGGTGEKMRIASDGAVTLKPNGITTGLRLQGRSSDNNFFIQWNNNDGTTNYASIGTDSANDTLQYAADNQKFVNQATNATALSFTSTATPRVHVGSGEQYGNTGKRGIRVGRTIYNWFNYGKNEGYTYLHIKTDLQFPTGSNPHPTMSTLHIKGYTYSAESIDSILGFHNWSGTIHNPVYTNNGTRTVVSSSWAPYRSSDNYVVIVLSIGNNYPGISIDWHQAFDAYTWRDISVLAFSKNTNTSGVY